jgi:hypothetical protein
MEEWIKYYDEAVSYSKVSQGAVQKGKLGNIVIYNMVSMSVEGFLTSILVNRGVYPHHSSIPSMFRELKKLMPIPDEFTPEIRFLNSFMNLCSLDVQAERIPTDEEIKRMSAFIAALHTWAEDSLITISKAC